MAAVEAVLTDRDGQKHAVSVPVQHNLHSLLVGVNQLAQNAARLLTELVDRQKTTPDFVRGDEDEDDEVVSDEEGEENNRSSNTHPPTKRIKT